MSMTSKPIGLNNFRMWWWHFELQCMNQEVTHGSFLFLARKSTSLLIFSTLLKDNPTRPMCISLFNKNVLTCNELTKKHASILTTLHMKSKAQRTKRRPSFIMTFKAFRSTSRRTRASTTWIKSPQGTGKHISIKTAPRFPSTL